MEIVKIKTKGQVTIPTELREQIGLQVGDWLKAEAKDGKITLTPQSVIDRRLDDSLEDYKHGRSYGPFKNAGDAIKFLHQQTKKRNRKSKKI